MKQSEINIRIKLDDNNVPEVIEWDATDKPDGMDTTNALNLSLWDDKQKNAMRIDLWTKDMTVTEMKMFYVNCIAGMAESIKTATNDAKMAEKMQELCRTLAKHIEEEDKLQR